MTIDDTARGLPLTPATAAVASLDLMGRRAGGKPAPYACCPKDGEPLISTLKFRGAEFVCMVCGDLLGFLSPTPQDPTPELEARHAELRLHFDAGVEPGTVPA